MKTIAILVGALALTSASQAAVVTFQYTGRVQSIVDGLDFIGDTGVAVPSFSLPDGDVGLQDTFSGTFSYDTAASPASQQSFPSGAQATYEQAASGAVLVGTFPASGAKVGGASPQTLINVWDLNPGVPAPDSFTISGITSRMLGATFATQVLALSFSGASTVLDSVALPGAQLPGFDDNTFEFYYERYVVDKYATVRVRGDITSLQFISAPTDVPEPSTLAIVGAGLGLLAWRRRRT